MTIIIGRMFGVDLETFLNKSIYILVQTYLRKIYSHSAQVKREASSELVRGTYVWWFSCLRSYCKDDRGTNYMETFTLKQLLVLFADIAWGLVLTHWHLWVFKHIWFAELAQELISFSDICEYLYVLIVFINLCMCTSPRECWLTKQECKKRVRQFQWQRFVTL